MEFYSERCADWLEKNTNIHPKKLEMEISRFNSMLTEAETKDAESDEVDDLTLTLQLLQERLIQLDPHSPALKTLAQSASVASSDEQNPGSAPAPEALSLQTNADLASPSEPARWDLTPLNPVDVEPEHIDEATRRERRAELLKIPGIDLGSKFKNS